MHKTTVYLPDDLKRALGHKARSARRSEAEVIREALAAATAAHQVPPRPRVGLFEGPAKELLEMVASGELRTIVGGTYPLAEARQAHEDLRGRKTVGKLVLDPRI